MGKINSSMYSSKNSDWETPQPLFDKLDEEFHFDIDLCALKKNAKCKRYFSRRQNALTRRWHGRCWMNPPYGDNMAEWIGKARWDSINYGATVVCLVPARTCTKWWHDWAMLANEIRFIKSRIKFVGGLSCAPFPSAVLVFRPGKCNLKVTSWSWK